MSGIRSSTTIPSLPRGQQRRQPDWEVSSGSETGCRRRTLKWVACPKQIQTQKSEEKRFASETGFHLSEVDSLLCPYSLNGCRTQNQQEEDYEKN